MRFEGDNHGETPSSVDCKLLAMQSYRISREFAPPPARRDGVAQWNVNVYCTRVASCEDTPGCFYRTQMAAEILEEKLRSTIQ